MRRVLPLVLIVSLAGCHVGCGATMRNYIRGSAKVAADLVIAIDADEQALPVSAEQHKRNGAVILTLTKAVDAYVAAAQAWPTSVSMPPDVPSAMAEALKAIAAVREVATALPGNGKLLANLNKIEAKIGGKS